MKIRLKTIVGSPLWGGIKGQINDVPDAVAASWIRGGMAEAVDDEPRGGVIETAAVKPPETAMMDRPVINAAGRRRRNR